MSVEKRFKGNIFARAYEEAREPANLDDKGLGFFSERRNAQERQSRVRVEMVGLHRHFLEESKPTRVTTTDKTSLALLHEYKEPEFDSTKLEQFQEKLKLDSKPLRLVKDQASQVSPRVERKIPIVAKRPAQQFVLGTRVNVRTATKREDSEGRSNSKKSTGQKSSFQSKNSRMSRLADSSVACHPPLSLFDSRVKSTNHHQTVSKPSSRDKKDRGIKSSETSKERRQKSLTSKKLEIEVGPRSFAPSPNAPAVRRKLPEPQPNHSRTLLARQVRDCLEYNSIGGSSSRQAYK